METRSKLKRQIEILGVCASEDEKFWSADLAHVFDCDEITVKRALNELRSQGIDIHSTKAKGVRINRPIDQRTLTDVLLQYFGICYSDTSVDRATASIVQKLGVQALRNVVQLQRCIESHAVAVVDYQSSHDKVLKSIRVCPLLAFQSDGNWRILAIHDQIVKQFLISGILSVECTDEKFKPPSRIEIDELFKFSFQSWLGPNRHRIRIRLKEPWSSRYKNRLLFPTQKVIDRRGSVTILEGTVNSLAEVAAWIAGKGGGVVAVEPQELRTMVNRLAEGVLVSHKARSKRKPA
jgi:predicted DNA-binding transcriptional regulator YafY